MRGGNIFLHEYQVKKRKWIFDVIFSGAVIKYNIFRRLKNSRIIKFMWNRLFEFIYWKFFSINFSLSFNFDFHDGSENILYFSSFKRFNLCSWYIKSVDVGFSSSYKKIVFSCKYNIAERFSFLSFFRLLDYSMLRILKIKFVNKMFFGNVP